MPPDTSTMQRIMIEVDNELYAGRPPAPMEGDTPDEAAFRAKMFEQIAAMHDRGEMLHFTPEAVDL
jgi:hypothetical protein